MVTSLVTSCTGGMAGSLQLNKRFEAAVSDVVGEDAFYQLRRTKGYEEAVRFFDQTVKRAFTGLPEESWYVNFPMADLQDDPTNHIKSNTWEMKRYVKSLAPGSVLTETFQ